MNCKTVKRSCHILVGLIIGFVLATHFDFNYETIRDGVLARFCSHQNPKSSASFVQDSSYRHSLQTLQKLIGKKKLQDDDNGTKKRLLLVGVMTAKKFLDSRAVAILQSWAKDLDGDIVFFSSAGSRADERIPLIALPGVDDSYPPQKKSFLMFKFMSDYFSDQYKFFMRADDDVFVNVGRLRKFLTNLNDSEPLFMGQTGVGNQDEFGQLNLDLHENFCMGGPGMLMSSLTLKILGQNVGYCLKNLHSTHEDVEIGRCVHRFAKTSCTWSYDMQRLFFHNSSIQQNILEENFPVKELHRAITVHPIKQPEAMAKLYQFYKRQEAQKLNRDITQAYQELKKNVREYSDEELVRILKIEDSEEFDQFKRTLQDFDLPNGTTDLENTWSYFAHKLFSEKSINPKRNIDRPILQAFQSNLQVIMDRYNRKSMKLSRILDVHGLYYGYFQMDPFQGSRYLLDIAMIYRKYQGKRMTIPIRRHAYAVQSFGSPHIRELSLNSEAVVNIVVPLAGRKEILMRFVQNLKNISRIDSKITLSLVVFLNDNDTIPEFEDFAVPLNVLKVHGNFSRGVALQKSLDLFRDEDLLLFLDVDMLFTSSVLDRVRRNTILGTQVYFPIVFSQYSNGTATNLDVNEDSGYWRQFGFGIASLYKRDLLTVGGYDVDIAGWGLEDVALYDRLIKSGMNIFRAVEPDLVHVHHPIHCDRTLASKQYEMCLGTMLSSSESIGSLADYSRNKRLL